MLIRRIAAGVLLALVACSVAPSRAQTETRPLPHPIVPPPHYDQAVRQETRTGAGNPGEAYWQNYASYRIDAVLSPATRVLRASGSIRYFNNSPDSLDRIYLHLRQNLHRPDAVRNRRVSITGGMQIGSLAANGDPLLERPRPGVPGYHIDGTIMRVELPQRLASGDSVELDINWSFPVPVDAPRMGQDGEVFYLGFWYPQLAVYDDVMGWNVDPYLGNGEFYMGFADYDVRLTVPEQWLVAATGTLQNPGSVLAPFVLERLNAAAETDSVVHVVTADERGTATVDSHLDVLTWHFRAEQVRDFAFGTSRGYVWDATVADVAVRGPIPAHALYRPGTRSWDQAAAFVRYSVEWLSERLTPYPFAHMTAVEGIIAGGMEYPMITLIGGTRTPETLFRTTFHEVAHMWYPMMVGQNEKAFAWMDEGLVSLLSDQSQEDYWGDAGDYYHRYYARVAGTGQEMPSMKHSDEFPIGGPARTAALYGKPVVALEALKGIVGEDAFDEALRAYTKAWAFRQPYPWDFFRYFNGALDRDLDWFWSALLFETWVLDHAIADVSSTSDAVIVRVEDRGLLPLPVEVQVTYTDGRSTQGRVEVEHWLQGHTRAEVSFPAGEVQEVVLDPDQIQPDVQRENDVWPRPVVLGATLRDE